MCEVRIEIGGQADVLRNHSAHHPFGLAHDRIQIQNLTLDHLLSAEGDELARKRRGSLDRSAEDVNLGA